jgi:hypothetical protein
MNKKIRRIKVGMSKGWFRQESIDPKTYATSKSTYTYHKQKAVKHPLNSGIANQFGAYKSLFYDVNLVIGFISQIQTIIASTNVDEVGDRANEVMLSGLSIAAFSIYGRCFTKADGRKLKLDEKVFQGAEVEVKNHRMIMHLRHNFAAHWGQIDEKGVLENSTILLTANTNGSKQFTVASEYVIPSFILQDEIQHNCEYLLDYIEEKLHLLYKKLKSEDKQLLQIVQNKLFRMLVSKAKMRSDDALNVIIKYLQYLPERTSAFSLVINGKNDITIIYELTNGQQTESLHAYKKETWHFKHLVEDDDEV